MMRELTLTELAQSLEATLVGADARVGGVAIDSRKLQPGEYWLSVRHKDPAATGTYSVGITTRRSRAR